jgi:hypothetical protein
MFGAAAIAMAVQKTRDQTAGASEEAGMERSWYAAAEEAA